MAIPVLTRQQVREFDRCAIEEYAIPGMVLMENAGRGCVDVLCRLGIAGPVVICCGKGNNAGDGLVMARHLQLRGFDPQLLFWADPLELTGDAGANYQIVSRAGLKVQTFSDPFSAEALAPYLASADWVVDALLGTGATGAPRAPLDQVIDAINASPARKLAVDLPSGLDCDTGVASTPCVRADHTCTFVAAKPGLVVESARSWVGSLHVLDIGAPGKLLSRFGIEADKEPGS